MIFPEGGTPRVITLGQPYPIQRVALTPYVDDPTTGFRWVAMDTEFQDNFLPAMAQQNIRVQWVEDPFYVEALQQLAALVNLDLAMGATAIVKAAVDQLRS